MEPLYCDNHLLVLDKPGGLLTQPSGTALESLESQAKQWVKEQFQKPGAVFLEAAHRIDRVACGVVLFARTSKALSRLNEAIRQGRCRKQYRALVENCSLPLHAEKNLRNWMVHGDHEAKVVAGAQIAGAKEATLHFRVAAVYSQEKRALLEIDLESGRYHQIRAQLAHGGMPIVGDALYGAKSSYHPGAIALQHYCLTIEHPVTHETMNFVSRQKL